MMGETAEVFLFYHKNIKETKLKLQGESLKSKVESFNFHRNNLISDFRLTT